MRCSNCSEENPSGRLFCRECGELLPTTDRTIENKTSLSSTGEADHRSSTASAIPSPSGVSNASGEADRRSSSASAIPSPSGVSNAREETDHRSSSVSTTSSPSGLPSPSLIERRTQANSYLYLSHKIWRVSYTADKPQMDIDPLQKAIVSGMKEYNMPMNVQVVDVITWENQAPEQRIRIQYNDDLYKIYTIWIGLKELGNFVHVEKWESVEDAPSPPDAELMWPKSTRLAVGIIVIGLLLLFAMDNIAFRLVGLAIVGYTGFALIHNQQYKQMIERYLEGIEDYRRKISTIFLSTLDTTRERMDDAVETVLKVVLEELYPQAELAKFSNRESEIRSEISDQFKVLAARAKESRQ